MAADPTRGLHYVEGKGTCYTPLCDHCDERATTTIDRGRGRIVRLCSLHANVVQFGGAK